MTGLLQHSLKSLLLALPALISHLHVTYFLSKLVWSLLKKTVQTFQSSKLTCCKIYSGSQRRVKDGRGGSDLVAPRKWLHKVSRRSKSPSRKVQDRWLGLWTLPAGHLWPAAEDKHYPQVKGRQQGTSCLLWMFLWGRNIAWFSIRFKATPQ